MITTVVVIDFERRNHGLRAIWSCGMLNLWYIHPWEICEYCEQGSTSVRRRRQNTAYVDEEKNWITCCGECYDRIQDCWDDMWREYYSDRL